LGPHQLSLTLQWVLLWANGSPLYLDPKYTEGDGLTYKDVDRVLHQEIYLPVDVMFCVKQIQIFHAVLAEIFGETTPMSRAVNVALNHVLINKPVHEEKQASHQNFLIVFCFKLDLMSQIFLRSCCDVKTHKTVNEYFLNVQPFLTAAMDLIFQVTLPCVSQMETQKHY
jgi:hypothetical protein